MTTSPDHDVLVIGAGPTGLTLAIQLLARGVPTRIVDRMPEPSPWSKALGIHARTLEAFATMGITERFLDAGHRMRHFRMYADSRPLLDLDLAHNGSPYGFVLHLPQAQTETLLRDRVLELGGRIERGVELTDVRQDADVAHAVLTAADGRTSTTTARFVVGCDGAHSRVRKAAGISFDGEAYDQDWVLADVLAEGVGHDDSNHAFFRADGLPLVCLPFGHGRWRLTFPEPVGHDDAPPSIDLVRTYVEQRAPHPITVGDPTWLTRFRAQLRRAGSYRAGRLLLAGDAAHIHSPAGAQGMNTGIQDAHNLAWKLALVLDGRASDRLLDSYETERRPVAGQVVGLSDRIVRLSTLRRPLARAVRDATMPRVTALRPVQSAAARTLAQVSISYAAGAFATDRGGPGPRPGGRVPDVGLRGAGRLWQRLGGGRHVLVATTDLSATAEAAGVDRTLVDVAVVDDASSWVRPGWFALVRPDGVLAARGRVADLAPVREQLLRLHPPAGGTQRSTAAPAGTPAASYSRR